jgi:hypothetical protein
VASFDIAFDSLNGKLTEQMANSIRTESICTGGAKVGRMIAALGALKSIGYGHAFLVLCTSLSIRAGFDACRG